MRFTLYGVASVIIFGWALFARCIFTRERKDTSAIEKALEKKGYRFMLMLQT